MLGGHYDDDDDGERDGVCGNVDNDEQDHLVPGGHDDDDDGGQCGGGGDVDNDEQDHLVPGGHEKTAPRLFVAVHSRYLFLSLLLSLSK